MLERNFAEQPVSPQNLSEWRNSDKGYKAWLRRRERLATTKSLANYSLQLAESGKSLLDGNAAILGGQLMEVFESIDIETQKTLLKEKPENLTGMILALAKLQDAGTQSKKLKQAERKLELAEEKFDLETQKFRRATAELFIKHCEDEAAKSIALSKQSKTIKLDRLVTHIFGRAPEEKS